MLSSLPNIIDAKCNCGRGIDFLLEGRHEMEQYPAVRFMVQHGAKLAVMVGISLPVLVLLGVLVVGWHWVWLVAAVVGGGALGFAFRTFAELTQIIADMLLPQ
jgi:hypothetical protein